MVVYAPLPARLLSHLRRRPSGTDLAAGDLDLMTEDGAVLATIEGLALRHVDLSRGWEGSDEPEPPARPAGSPPGEPAGVDPDGGLDLLMGLLAAGVSGAVLVPPHLKGQPAPAPAVRDRGSDDARADHVVAELSKVWMHILGTDRFRDEDDFFGTGGDSLAAVDLMARVRSAFGIELGIGALIDASTFGELRSRIEEAIGQATGSV